VDLVEEFEKKKKNPNHSTLAVLAQSILFSEMLNFFPKKFLKDKNFVMKNKESF
jgi:hypothetical protein